MTTGLLAEVDYGVTERFAASVAIPFVFARYTGDPIDFPFPRTDGEKCLCWHQSFQDFSIAGRYRFGDDFLAFTPQVRVIIPSHDYPYEGEAVVGSNLNQVLLGISGAWRLAFGLPNASVQAGYMFALVEKATDVRPNRSSAFMSFGYEITRSLRVHGGATYLQTHAGLTGSELTRPGTPSEQVDQRDRLLKARYAHLTGGLSYVVGSNAELFFAVQPYVWGRDTHDGIAYTLGATWYFDWSR